MQTKSKLSVTVTTELIPRAKLYARSRGKSLSQLIDGYLRDLVEDESQPLGDKWVGQFVLADKREDPIYDAIVAKHAS